MPKDGCYKGTITMLLVSEGSKVSIKKVYPIFGTITGSAMELAMTEFPADTGYFTGSVFTGTVTEGDVSLLPNNNAQRLRLFGAKTTANSLKGNTDLGFAQSVGNEVFEFRRFISIAMTRVEN